VLRGQGGNPLRRNPETAPITMNGIPSTTEHMRPPPPRYSAEKIRRQKNKVFARALWRIAERCRIAKNCPIVGDGSPDGQPAQGRRRAVDLLFCFCGGSGSGHALDLKLRFLSLLASGRSRKKEKKEKKSSPARKGGRRDFHMEKLRVHSRVTTTNALFQLDTGPAKLVVTRHSLNAVPDFEPCGLTQNNVRRLQASVARRRSV